MVYLIARTHLVRGLFFGIKAREGNRVLQEPAGSPSWTGCLAKVEERWLEVQGVLFCSCFGVLYWRGVHAILKPPNLHCIEFQIVKLPKPVNSNNSLNWAFPHLSLAEIHTCAPFPSPHALLFLSFLHACFCVLVPQGGELGLRTHLLTWSWGWPAYPPVNRNMS